MIRTFFFSILFFAVSSGAVDAASVGFGAHQTTSGNVYMLPLLVATDGTPINAVEGSITVPRGITDVYDASSIVAFWTTPPSIKNGEVAFSGIIPGGFEGTGILFWLVYEGGVSTEGVRIDSFIALQNDGEGTSEEVSIETDGRLVIPGGIVSIAEDITPPEPFSIAIIDISGSSGTERYAASFATRDNETGIDRYEVQETTARDPAEDEWMVAESPYELRDQSRGSTVFVRAIDNAGNIREGSQESSGGGLRLLLLVIGALALIIGIWRFSRKQRII